LGGSIVTHPKSLFYVRCWTDFRPHRHHVLDISRPASPTSTSQQVEGGLSRADPCRCRGGATRSYSYPRTKDKGTVYWTGVGPWARWDVVSLPIPAPPGPPPAAAAAPAPARGLCGPAQAYAGVPQYSPGQAWHSSCTCAWVGIVRGLA
jgi:hypothetical protein